MSLLSSLKLSIPVLLGILAPKVSAVTSISDGQMTSFLNTGALDLARMYGPVWFFGQSQNQVPCYPTWAFGGSPTTNDTYDALHKTAAAPQCQYPNVGCSCRNPGVPIGNQGPAFPIYYTYQRCNDTEVRVAYNLFYQKDGAQFGTIATGHDYDWERAVVIHSKNPSTSTWTPSQLFTSAHSGYKKYFWGSVQNTLSDADATSGKGPVPNGQLNLDHPKVYVAWSKHAMYDDRNTGYNDVISQSTDNAFRSQDWWYFVPMNYYVRADRSTAAGAAVGSADWGDATSNPPSVNDGLCAA